MSDKNCFTVSEKTPFEASTAINDASSDANHQSPLEKRFNVWSTSALQFSLICSALAIGTFLSTVVGVGGSPGLIYGYILAVTFDLFICYSLAEIASAYPHSSAQIHWTYVLAPRGTKRGMSFAVGILSCAGWIFACFSSTYVATGFFYALVAVYNPDFAPTNWQMYLTYAAIVVVGSCINAVAVAALPFITHMLVGIINSTTVFILVALLVKSSPKQSASFVFSTFINETGWSSDGLVFFLGLLPSIASVTLYDGACHMTDEIDKPEVHIPWVMVLSNTSSAILGLVAAIIYMFCTKNVDTLSSPIGGQPIVQLMMDAFESNALTTVGVVALIMSFVGSSFTYYTTTSRLFWSFARSNGLPFGDIFAAVNSTLKVPVNAVGLVTALCLILGLIILGSSSALTAVLGSSMVCINLSYIFPIGALLWRSGFSRNIRTRYADGPDVLSMMVVDPKTALPYFHLGKFGVVLNVASVVWVCFIMVWLNFPTVHPVQSGTMNYACVVLGSTAVVGVIFWFAARKKYDHDVNGKHVI
ncbi:hypothetical protein CANTEDRAFT_135564 [Yamadazyma tenuis ATCC 10573]|uniref:Amino acid transporter n=1 Tax=Candida tenuis (strain ATCC 10573 / BCRC 21748 / CBS 615 / JCM 9827 / NBRC 10315 / NRRL Y-1498 / VKM Y-70) TaxID=590646 RepID=G3B7I7_CANTC|nr:uncharacterized protein CANTEDRAFT_135564 [Yamadazyma tenuis ATCC 10573]EGV61625.1 hypothetical protein CANTEDRAFT_135564 [Yamadazyma tenuis ATCC 10573]